MQRSNVATMTNTPEQRRSPMMNFLKVFSAFELLSRRFLEGRIRTDAEGFSPLLVAEEE